MDSLGCGMIVVILVIILTIEFFIVAGLTWVFCWAFGGLLGIVFSWKLATGVWAVVMLLTMIFGKKTVTTND